MTPGHGKLAAARDAGLRGQAMELAAERFGPGTPVATRGQVAAILSGMRCSLNDIGAVFGVTGEAIRRGLSAARPVPSPSDPIRAIGDLARHAEQAQRALDVVWERFGPGAPGATRREAAAILRSMGFCFPRSGQVLSDSASPVRRGRRPHPHDLAARGGPVKALDELARQAEQAKQALRDARERFGPATPPATRLEVAASLRAMGFDHDQIGPVFGVTGETIRQSLRILAASPPPAGLPDAPTLVRLARDRGPGALDAHAPAVDESTDLAGAAAWFGIMPQVIGALRRYRRQDGTAAWPAPGPGGTWTYRTLALHRAAAHRPGPRRRGPSPPVPADLPAAGTLIALVRHHGPAALDACASSVDERTDTAGAAAWLGITPASIRNAPKRRPRWGTAAWPEPDPDGTMTYRALVLHRAAREQATRLARARFGPGTPVAARRVAVAIFRGAGFSYSELGAIFDVSATAVPREPASVIGELASCADEALRRVAAATLRDLGCPSYGIAAAFGVSPRTVHKYLSSAGAPPGPPGWRPGPADFPEAGTLIALVRDRSPAALDAYAPSVDLRTDTAGAAAWLGITPQDITALRKYQRQDGTRAWPAPGPDGTWTYRTLVLHRAAAHRRGPRPPAWRAVPAELPDGATLVSLVRDRSPAALDAYAPSVDLRTDTVGAAAWLGVTPQTIRALRKYRRQDGTAAWPAPDPDGRWTYRILVLHRVAVGPPSWRAVPAALPDAGTLIALVRDHGPSALDAYAPSVDECTDTVGAAAWLGVTPQTIRALGKYRRKDGSAGWPEPGPDGTWTYRTLVLHRASGVHPSPGPAATTDPLPRPLAPCG